MPKSVAPGRFPVPLRRSLPAEADMLQELESLKGVYGGINERMREWLLRGITELEQRTKLVPSADGDATRALMAVAMELVSSVAISQHLLTMYAQAKETLAAGPMPRAAASPEQFASVPAPAHAPAESAEPPVSSEPAATDAEPSERPRWGHLKGLVGG